MTTEKVHPFKRQGQHVVSDVVLDDYVMPNVSGNAYKILRLIVRWTKGENKDRAALSYVDIRTKAGIGSDQTITKGLKELFDLQVIIKFDPARNWSKASYSLNPEFEIEISTSENEVGSTSKTVVPVYNNNNIDQSNIVTKKEKESGKKKKKVLTDQEVWDKLPTRLVRCAKFVVQWKKWMEWRAKDGFDLHRHETAVEGQGEFLAEFPDEVAIEMVRKAWTGQWKGLHRLQDWDPVVTANQTATKEKPLADAGGHQREALKGA